MKTTVEIDEGLLREAEAEAAKGRTTVARLIEEGLALRLCAGRADVPPKAFELPELPVYHGRGGFLPHITDTLSNQAFYDVEDEEAAA